MGWDDTGGPWGPLLSRACLEAPWPCSVGSSPPWVLSPALLTARTSHGPGSYFYSEATPYSADDTGWRPKPLSMVFLCRSLHVVAQHFSLCKADAFALLQIRLTLWFSPCPQHMRLGVVSPESPWKRLVLTQPSGVGNAFSSWFGGQAGVVGCVCVCVCVCVRTRMYMRACSVVSDSLQLFEL